LATLDQHGLLHASLLIPTLVSDTPVLTVRCRGQITTFGGAGTYLW